MKKFKQPLAIRGSTEQLIKLREELLKLGYKEYINRIYEVNHLGVTMCTNAHGISNQLTYYTDSSTMRYKRMEVFADNPDLVIALAAMVDDEQFHAGEYVILTGGVPFAGCNIGEMTKIIEIDPDSSDNFRAWDKDTNQEQDGFHCSNQWWRKATVEEIIQNFSITQVQEEKLIDTDIEAMYPESYAPVQEFILPEKWAVKRTKENYQVINEYFNKLYKTKGFSSWRSSRSTNGIGYQNVDYSYLHFPKIKRKTSTVHHEVWNGYTVISYSKFLEFVVNKQENKQTMEREIIGYNPKEEKYIKPASDICQDLDLRGGIYSFSSKGYQVHFTEDSDVKKRMESLGLLDLWFEPVYEEQFKAGDWVVGWHVEDDERKTRAWQIQEISGEFAVVKNTFGHNTDLANIRKATPQEIKDAQVTKLVLGSNNATVEVGINSLKSRGYTIDFSTLDKLYTKLNSVNETSLGTWHIKIPIGERFIQVGCDIERNLFSLREVKQVLDTYRKLNP